MSSPEKSLTQFLNIDLDLRTQHGLDELLEHLGPTAFVLQRTTYEACLELNEQHESLEDTAFNLVKLIQSLPPRAKILWNQCEFRRLNIGIQAGDEPQQAYFTISNKTVSLLASEQFEIVITVYARPRP